MIYNVNSIFSLLFAWMIKFEYFCNNIAYIVVLTMVTGNILHNVKRHWCFVLWLSETWEISNCWSWTMSEVSATGMLNCIPECAVRVYNTLRTLLWERATYWRGQTLHSFTNKVFSGPQKRTSGCGSPRFLLCNQNF